MNTQKGFSSLLGLLLFIVLAGGGLFFIQKRFVKEIPEANTVSVPTQIETEKIKIKATKEITNATLSDEVFLGIIGDWKIKDESEDQEVNFISFQKGGPGCPDSNNYITIELAEVETCSKSNGDRLSYYVTSSGFYPELSLIPVNEDGSTSGDKIEIQWTINVNGELELVYYYNGNSEIYSGSENKYVEDKSIFIRKNPVLLEN